MTEAIRTCSIDGCDRKHAANDLCAMHNTRMWRLGTTELPPPRTRQKCIYPGCDKWRESHGYCSTHWRRVQRHDDPSVVLKSGKPRSGTMTTTNGGYLMAYEPEHPLASKSGQVLVHRIVLYEKIGPGSHACHTCGRVITWGLDSKRDRLEVDHLDGNRQNNDPANLVPSCHACNDGQALRRRTHCSQGHEFTPENTYVGPNGYRRCRECMRESDRRRRRR